jgi:glycosyltransferase involved in cell wall biosynthesis
MIVRTPETPPIINPLPDNIRRPIWSVMISTYNCIDYFKEALESVLFQDPGPEKMQIEVIDDASTDGDYEYWVNKIGKGRVSIFRQKENVGSLRNFETCINRSTGLYVHILHGDDCVVNGFYDEVESLYNKFPEIGAAFTGCDLIDKNSKKLDNIYEVILDKPGIITDFLPKIALRQLIQPPSIVVKRCVYEALGSFYAVHYGEDWEMWVRIASHFPIAYSPKHLALYRVANDKSISYCSFISGQNVRDLNKVIEIIQNYIPKKQRDRIKKESLKLHSIYCIKVANGLLSDNRKKLAFAQVKGALNMHTSITTLYWACRFYLMYLLHYNQIRTKVRNFFPITKD